MSSGDAPSSGAESNQNESDLPSDTLFYCHGCHLTTRSSPNDYACSQCGSGFIEAIESQNNGNQDDADEFYDAELDVSDDQSQEMADQLFRCLMVDNRSPRGNGSTTISSGVSQPSSGNQSAPVHSETSSSQPFSYQFSLNDMGDMTGGTGVDPRMFLQDIFNNINSGMFASAGGDPSGGSSAQFFFSPPGMQLYGNPGDYAWGHGGLDAVVTQLLNRMDGAGPPPMKEDSIDRLPKVSMTQQLLEKNAECAVCWDDFEVDQKDLIQLDCDHIFHEHCITPWLKLHGSCPVCRKLFEADLSTNSQTSSAHQNSSNFDNSEHNSRTSVNGISGTDDSNSNNVNHQPPPVHVESVLGNAVGSTLSAVFDLFGGGAGAGGGRFSVNQPIRSQSHGPSSHSNNSNANDQQDYQDFDVE